ncbi:MAG: ABC transporter ATP-binding protein, partial [Oscillospiraceae bacterium]|nr:ABC transporter ATP-binding protein [Oscillospiraceae bacterium]
TQGPLLELTPPYQPGASLADLIDEGVLNPSFAAFDSVGMPLEGTISGGLELLIFIVEIVGDIISHFSPDSKLNLALSLLGLVLIVFLLIYRIRIFMRVTRVFGLRKRWILLYLLLEWLPMLIIGFGNKYQPKWTDFSEEWEAGTAPAELEGTEKPSDHVHVFKNEGLSLELRDRTVSSFGRKQYLLKDIALDIPNGSFVLLLGGSGAGKTTLVNAIIGYEKANATVKLNGSDVYKDYGRMKYRIGFVPQKNLMRGTDTVMHTVTDAARLRIPKNLSKDERKAKTQEVMDLLGLTAGSDGLVNKKSGGQLRRISIAMELVTDPELFILDEPDSGLDGVISREIFTKLRAIADSGTIVIVITHTPDRVIDLFDKVIVLGRDSGRVGRLAFYGSPQEAREFFGKDTMEDVVMTVNRKEEGGDGLADECIERYARLVSAAEGGAAS